MNTNDPHHIRQPLDEVLFHCFKCKRTFLSLSACRSHREKDKCASAYVCEATHEHKMIHETFDTMSETLEWYQANELDRYFRIRQSSQILKFKHFKCSQSTASKSYKHAKTRKTHPCQARLTIRQMEICHCQEATREKCLTARHRFILEGCVTHSHPMDRDKLRLSQVTKDRIWELLRSGHSHNEIVAMCNDDQDHQSKPVIVDDVFRLKRVMEKRGDSLCINPMNKEETQLMSDVVKLEEKLKSIKEVIASKRIKMEEKRTLVEALETMPLKKVNVPVFPDFSSS